MELENESSFPSSNVLQNQSTPSSSELAQVLLKRKTGRKKFRETRHPIYRGVRRKNGNKWVCEVREPKKKSRIWLGTFPSPEMAARAYDVAALAHRTKSPVLNFSDSAWLLPRPKSSSAEDIRLAALDAAEAFRPSKSSSSSVKQKDLCGDKRSKNKVLEPSEDVKSPTKVVEASTTSSSLFIDEEALFDMPRLLEGIAEGMLLTLPTLHEGLQWDDTDSIVDLTLWNID